MSSSLAFIPVSSAVSPLTMGNSPVNNLADVSWAQPAMSQSLPQMMVMPPITIAPPVLMPSVGTNWVSQADAQRMVDEAVAKKDSETQDQVQWHLLLMYAVARSFS